METYGLIMAESMCGCGTIIIEVQLVEHRILHLCIWRRDLWRRPLEMDCTGTCFHEVSSGSIATVSRRVNTNHEDLRYGCSVERINRVQRATGDVEYMLL
jgi:hypothetical protein